MSRESSPLASWNCFGYVPDNQKDECSCPVPGLTDLFLGQLLWEVSSARYWHLEPKGKRDHVSKWTSEEGREGGGEAGGRGGESRLYADPAGLVIWKPKLFSLFPLQHKQTQSQTRSNPVQKIDLWLHSRELELGRTSRIQKKRKRGKDRAKPWKY